MRVIDAPVAMRPIFTARMVRVNFVVDSQLAWQ
jgi:hypothetical protein